MTKVLFEANFRVHSMFRWFFLFPPEGFEFLSNVKPFQPPNVLMKYAQTAFGFPHKFPIQLAESLQGSFRRTEAALTFSHGHLVLRPSPWVLYLERVTQPVGFNQRVYVMAKRLIEKYIAKDNCKAVLAFSDCQRRVILGNLRVPKLEEKTSVLLPSVPSRTLTSFDERRDIRLLFVGSSNSLSKDEFLVKGGREAIESYVKLKSIYPRVKMTVISTLPDALSAKYKSIDGLTLIKHPIPWSRLLNELYRSDIFIHPSYHDMATVVLDAMSIGLPVITTDLGGNREIITDGLTGLLVEPSRRIVYESGDSANGPPRSWLDSVRVEADQGVVEGIVLKARMLIDDLSLRKRISENAWNEVSRGRLSIEKRNAKLKSVFSEALE